MKNINKEVTTKVKLLINKAVNMMLEDVGSMTYPQLVKHFQEGYEYFEKSKSYVHFYTFAKKRQFELIDKQLDCIASDDVGQKGLKS